MTGSEATGALFSWIDQRFVIFVERTPSGWALSRGWRLGDRIEHVRRWEFESPRRVTGQIRRLVLEATGNPATAAAVALELASWLDAQS